MELLYAGIKNIPLFLEIATYGCEIEDFRISLLCL